MLYRAKTLLNYKLDSLDGDIGKVRDFYFDDKYWAVRYLVADTGNYLTGRQVLISPYNLIAVNKEKEHISIDLTKMEIEGSPSLNSDKPVSQQFEQEYYGYYDWPTYWTGPFMWGSSPNIMRDPEKRKDPASADQQWNPHLRSTKDISGHHVQATDGEIGHVKDFLIDDEAWAIRYLMVDTQNWWPGKTVLISPQWVESVSWNQSKVMVNLAREAIQQSPEYTNESQLTREYETGLHRHYDRERYWSEEPISQELFTLKH